MPLPAKRLRPCLRPVLTGLLLLPFLAMASGARAATPTAEQKAVICGTRSSCKVTRMTDAGKDGEGRALAIVELHLALADKPVRESCSASIS
jgi:hypothetical protein